MKRDIDKSLLAKAKVEYGDFLELAKNNYSYLLLSVSSTNPEGDRTTLERDLLITWDWIQGAKAKTLAEQFGLSPERIRDICVRQLRKAYYTYHNRKGNFQIQQSAHQFNCQCGVSLQIENANPTLLRGNGWLILLSHQGGIYYACSNCAGKIQKAAEVMAKYSDRFVNLAPLVKY
jgi:hypothetical protein